MYFKMGGAFKTVDNFFYIRIDNIVHNIYNYVPTLGFHRHLKSRYERVCAMTVS